MYRLPGQRRFRKSAARQFGFRQRHREVHDMLVRNALVVMGAAVALQFACGIRAADAPPPGATGAAPGAARAGGAADVIRTVQSIKFTGNQKISSEKLLQLIGLKVGDVNTKEAVGGSMTKIVDAYKALGSDLALMVDISLPDPAHTAINFLVDEAGTGGNKGAAPRAGGPPRGGAAPAAVGAPPTN
jgi:hypothetical protein